MVVEQVEKFFGRSPRKDVNPDEAVAVGAAIQGQVLGGGRSDVLLLDVTPLSLGIETLGGVMTKMIRKNTTIPTKHSQTYSTADHNQPGVSIKVYQGEREIVVGNKALGEFMLEGIEPAPKGVPQIEVTFDIDANGILDVKAVDKKTGKEKQITIKASSGLSEEEIERMVKDAELNAEEDKKIVDLVLARNQLDGSIGNLEKKVEELGDYVPTEDKTAIEQAITQAKATAAGDNKDDMDKAVETLQEWYQKTIPWEGEKRNKEMPAGDPSQQGDPNVVDAEVKETKEAV
jgi:molecular chaperone DnaK